VNIVLLVKQCLTRNSSVVFNKKAKERILLCNVVQCMLAEPGKWPVILVCTRRGPIFDERVLQACRGGF
jgi:hypothetical protein